MKFGLSDLGIVCALGCGKAEVLKNALASSVRGMQKSGDVIANSETFLGVADFELPQIENSRHNTRCNALALAAALQIEDKIRGAISKYGAGRVGVVLGSSNTGMREFQREHFLYTMQNSQKRPSAFHGELGNVAEFIAGYFNLSAPSYVISTACSSSAKAFASAQNLLQSGVCDAVICGGADSICNFVVNGFYSLGAISKSLTNPMSKNRSGINIGEGAAIFLMQKEPAAINLAGVGESSDAYHATTPDPSGEGAMLSMRAALANSGFKPSDIQYVNLHGTGTAFNDSMEAKAVWQVLGGDVLCSSTKPMTGHTLGAAGAIEAGLCYLMMSDMNEKRAIIEHVYDGQYDENLPRINLAGGGLSARVKCALSNSFAFGGSNASVILEG
ncbi:MAG: beta-ketoacyl-ACP synthase [Opitutales bacterium]|nr:beta-ketoacyl-ACP synthase [Opitutales bacterium]